MTTRYLRLTCGAALAATIGVLLPASVTAQTAEAQYSATKSREDEVRKAIAETARTAPAAARTPVIREARAVIATYEALVR